MRKFCRALEIIEAMRAKISAFSGSNPYVRGVTSAQLERSYFYKTKIVQEEKSFELYLTEEGNFASSSKRGSRYTQALVELLNRIFKAGDWSLRCLEFVEDTYIGGLACYKLYLIAPHASVWVSREDLSLVKIEQRAILRPVRSADNSVVKRPPVLLVANLLFVALVIHDTVWAVLGLGQFFLLRVTTRYSAMEHLFEPIRIASEW